MKQQAYDIRSLRAYLLGSLSDAETERFDEMSFSDDDFNDILNSVEHDLTDAYANGELFGDELERFNAHYLASPRRREKVNFAKEFRGFVALENANLNAEEEKTPKRAFVSLLSARVAQWGFVAATIALAVVSGLFWLQNSRLEGQLNGAAQNSYNADERKQDLEKQVADLRAAGDQANAQIAAATEERDRLQRELDQANTQTRSAEPNTNAVTSPSEKPAPPVIASFMLAPQLRGSGPLPRLSLPKDTSQVVLRLKLEPNDFSSYFAILRDPDTGRTVWQTSRLRTSRQGDQASLSVSIPAKLLNSKVYTISLSGLASSGPPESFSDYTFQVVR